MRSGLPALILAGMTCIAAATPAQAVICYVIYDRNENIIYQSTYPPMDMSSAGYSERDDALRAWGEHLTFGDIDKCPTMVFLTGAGGTSDLRVDEVVAGMSARNIPGTQSTGTAMSGAPGNARSTPARAPAATAAPAAKPRSY
jgi:hypothetical protein